MSTSARPVLASGTIAIGGDLTVHRLGFGAMRITGTGIWGPPADRDAAIAVLRRAVELGVDFVDTADSYGPHVSEQLICDALHPYDGLLIATKGGLARSGPGVWEAIGRPEYLRQCVEMSLRRLGVEQIGLYQLHRIDPKVPAAESLGALKELQDAGKIRHIGLSEVTVGQIEAARSVVEVVSVQNLYNVANRRSEDVVVHCEREGIAFIPWLPVVGGKQSEPGGALEAVAEAHDATQAQIALAWLLRRSPVMLPIPGTSSVAHLEENCAAAEIERTDDDYASLTSPGA